MKIAYFSSRIILSLTISLTFNANAAEQNSHIRTLAASCSICHALKPGNETVIPALSGLDESYFVKKMESFRNSPNEHDVMVQHAKGLTMDEIELLAVHFSEQLRYCPIAKKVPAAESWSH